MKILITGGAGYVGSALCEALLKDTSVEQITVYDNLSRHNFNLFIGVLKLDSRVKFVEGDVLDSRKLRTVVKEADVVVHLAAKVSTPFADQDAHLFEQVNHWGTAELTYAVEDAPKVKSLIYLSSVSVYGAGEEQKQLDSPLNPQSFYGISKLRGEHHVQRLEDRCNINIIRCGNVYGYNRSMRFDAVINKLLFDANFYRKINVHGNGTQHRPFVHIDTVTQVLAKTILTDGAHMVSNLVEHNYSVNEVVQALQELYPDLETIFINNNMKMRELKVDLERGNLVAQNHDKQHLVARLKAFKSAFTF